MNEWIGEAVGLMHINKIMAKEVAEEMGVTPVYLSMIMNGKKKVRDEEHLKSRVFGAINAIETKRAKAQLGTEVGDMKNRQGHPQSGNAADNSSGV